MSTSTVKKVWLEDKTGAKIAPKTLVSQVQTADGILLEDKIQSDLNIFKEEVLEEAALPTVSTTDNGKFLRVVSGVWAAASIPNAEEATF